MTNYDFYREIRKPHIARLRWGKRDDDEAALNYLHQLAFEEALDDDNVIYDDKSMFELVDEQKPRAIEQHVDDTDVNNKSVPDFSPGVATAAAVGNAEEKRAPTNLRLRWGRSYDPKVAPSVSVSFIYFVF